MVSFVFDTDEDTSTLEEAVEAFVEKLDPVEVKDILLFRDECTGAVYTECHLMAESLVSNGTDDVPLDPDNSSEYRANRKLVDDHAAYAQMRADALKGRAFSNLVCEYIKGESKELKIIGGQHRFNAIKDAYDEGVNQHHGTKVYFNLDKDQRLDVQVISNTNITVSKDLLDRMFETLSGSELRGWAQEVGLLARGEDFADKRKRGSPISVQAVRTFIINFYEGKKLAGKIFSEENTTPEAVRTGVANPPKWVEVKKEHPELWDDPDLKVAGKEYAALRKAQEEAFVDKKSKKPISGTADFRDKAANMAVTAAWAFVAGALQDNETRLKKHYELKAPHRQDPLKAAVLAKARHATDAENYRGLGYRTDPQERGRLVELFWIQAEKGGGITTKMVEVALESFHAKQANLKLKKLAAGL